MSSRPPPWSKTLPKEPGWYWLRRRDGSVLVVHLFRSPRHQEMRVEWPSDAMDTALAPEYHDGERWSGPLEEPK